MDKFKLNIKTTIYFGYGEFEKIKKTASTLGKKALVVIGKGSVKKNGTLDKLKNYLKEEKIEFEVFEGVEPNPRSSTINKAGMIAKEIKADMVIALGGGSVMDASKGIAIVAKENIDIWQYCMISGRKTKKVVQALPIICIPTLAATGSEVDRVAVITNDTTKQKASLHDEKVIPKFAIIDPSLTQTVPIEYLIDGAIDIIAHSIETYLSNSRKNRLQDYFTLGLSRSAKEAIEKLLQDPNDKEAREDLSLASSYAMVGILSGRNGGWPIHLIEHSISALYDISHGLGLALLMPAVMEFSSSENKDKVNELIGFMLHQDMNFYKDVKIAINDFKKWLEDIKAIRPLKQSIDHEEVANNVIKTYGNEEESIYGIKPMYKTDILKILKSIN